MNSRKYRWEIIAASVLSYVLIAVVVLQSVWNFRAKYRQEEDAYIEEVKEQMIEAINSDNTAAQLDQLIEDYAVEVILYDDQEQIIYESVKLREGEKLRGVVNDNAKFSEAAGTVIADGKEYYLWYTIYQIPFVKIMEGFLFKINIMVVLVYLAQLGLIGWFERRLLRPLYKVADSLQRAENNELEAIENEEHYDILNSRLNSFFVNQRKALKEIHHKNTSLELELALEREHLENTIQLSRALVHDLKGPLHQTMIENEMELEKAQNKERQNMLLSNIKLGESLIMEVNGILKVLREDVYHFDKSLELMDGVAAILSAQKHNRPEMRKKGLNFFFEGPETELFYQNKVGIQLLLHNIFSNMVHYSLEGTEIEVSLERKDKNIEIIARNISNTENIARMKASENLAYIAEAHASDPEYRFSSGNGMYLIRDLAALLGGAYCYTVDGCMIINTLIIPDKEKDT